MVKVVVVVVLVAVVLVVVVVVVLVGGGGSEWQVAAAAAVAVAATGVVVDSAVAIRREPMLARRSARSHSQLAKSAALAPAPPFMTSDSSSGMSIFPSVTGSTSYAEGSTCSTPLVLVSSAALGSFAASEAIAGWVRGREGVVLSSSGRGGRGGIDARGWSSLFPTGFIGDCMPAEASRHDTSTSSSW